MLALYNAKNNLEKKSDFNSVVNVLKMIFYSKIKKKKERKKMMI